MTLDTRVCHYIVDYTYPTAPAAAQACIQGLSRPSFLSTYVGHMERCTSGVTLPFLIMRTSPLRNFASFANVWRRPRLSTTFRAFEAYMPSGVLWKSERRRFRQAAAHIRMRGLLFCECQAAPPPSLHRSNTHAHKHDRTHFTRTHTHPPNHTPTHIGSKRPERCNHTVF